MQSLMTRARSFAANGTACSAAAPVIVFSMVCALTLNAQQLGPTHAAVQSGDSAAVAAALKAGASVDERDGSSATPLHRAAWKGFGPIVQLLIARGATINAVDSVGQTALNLAVMFQHDGIVDALLQAGANPNVFSRADNFSPYSRAIVKGATSMALTMRAHGGVLGPKQTAFLDEAAKLYPTTVGLALAAVRAAEPPAGSVLVKTVEGCTFWERLVDSTASVRSDIPCHNGKLDGEGVLRYFRGGHQYWEWQVGDARGIRMVAGVLRPTLDPGTLRFHAKSCNTGLGWIAAEDVTAPPGLAFENMQLTAAIDSLARAALVAECGSPLPADKTSYRFDLMIYADTGANPNPWVGKTPGWIGWPENVANRFATYWKRREDDAIERDRQVAQRAEIARAAEARRVRRQELQRQYGQFQLSTFEVIAPNPYLWKDKLIGTCATFESMASESVALVRGRGMVQAVLTGVPMTRFSRPTVVFLIARVSGQVNGLTSLRFVTAVDHPRDEACSDFIDP